MARLNNKDKATIRKYHAEGISKRKLSMLYGVSRSAIRYIVDDEAREEQNTKNKKNYYERKKSNG